MYTCTWCTFISWLRSLLPTVLCVVFRFFFRCWFVANLANFVIVHAFISKTTTWLQQNQTHMDDIDDDNKIMTIIYIYIYKWSNVWRRAHCLYHVVHDDHMMVWRPDNWTIYIYIYMFDKRWSIAVIALFFFCDQLRFAMHTHSQTHLSRDYSTLGWTKAAFRDYWRPTGDGQRRRKNNVRSTTIIIIK